MENLVIRCVLLSVIGIALQVLVKMKGLKARSQAAGKPFSVGEYFKDDWITILITIFVVLAAIIIITSGSEQVKKFSPLLLMLVFMTLGYTGSSIVQAFFSASEKKMLTVISNGVPPAADPLDPPPNNLN